jgi:hypothetical protein
MKSQFRYNCNFLIRLLSFVFGFYTLLQSLVTSASSFSAIKAAPKTYFEATIIANLLRTVAKKCLL